MGLSVIYVARRPIHSTSVTDALMTFALDALGLEDLEPFCAPALDRR
jgi:hypothetical protein